MRALISRSGRTPRWCVLCAGGLLLLALSAVAAEPIKKKFPTAPNPLFQLHSHVGTVTVKGWDQGEIDIQVQPASDAVDVVIVGDEQKVSVQSHPKREGVPPQQARLDFAIRVPRQASIRLHTERGEIVVENVEGNVIVEGISTAISLSDVRGNITVSTVEGPITIQSAEGIIKAESISGDLKFVGVNATKLQATTNSGAIRYQGDFGMGGTYVLNNYSSLIDIVASAKASFDLTARAVQGLIESNLPFNPTPRGTPFRRLSAGKFLQGRFNSGQSTVQVTSYSGTIRVHGPRP